MSSQYSPRVDRRTTLKWLASVMTASLAACGDGKNSAAPGDSRDALLGSPAPVRGLGYGSDPDLMSPVRPWPKTMTSAQLKVSAALCDVIIPQDETSPSASAVGVPDFIDEWVSAPYPEQRQDRETVLAGLEWLEQESLKRFSKGFAEAADEQCTEVVDDIADADASSPHAEQALFFRRFRYLTIGAFYTTDEGIADIGYLGNRPILSPYPGPTKEAMDHLNSILADLGLPL